MGRGIGLHTWLDFRHAKQVDELLEFKALEGIGWVRITAKDAEDWPGIVTYIGQLWTMQLFAEYATFKLGFKVTKSNVNHLLKQNGIKIRYPKPAAPSVTTTPLKALERQVNQHATVINNNRKKHLDAEAKLTDDTTAIMDYLTRQNPNWRGEVATPTPPKENEYVSVSTP